MYRGVGDKKTGWRAEKRLASDKLVRGKSEQFAGLATCNFYIYLNILL